jgi:hypothetical protein
MRSKRVTKLEAKQPERRAVMTASAARERILRAVDERSREGSRRSVSMPHRAGVNKMSSTETSLQDQLIPPFWKTATVSTGSGGIG